MKAGKENWIQSHMTLTDLFIGKQVLDNVTKQLSTIEGLTSCSVLVFGRANQNSIKKSNKKKVEEVKTGDWIEVDETIEIGKLKGVDSSMWFYIDDFNKRFIDLTLDKICQHAINELHLRIDRNVAKYLKK